MQNADIVLQAVDAQYSSGTFVESNDEHIARSDKIPSDPDADNWDDFSNVIFDNYGSVNEFHHCQYRMRFP